MLSSMYGACKIHHTLLAGTDTMPAWMSLLHGSVASKDTPQYARLFLVKAVLHVEARHTARADAASQQEQVNRLIPLPASWQMRKYAHRAWKHSCMKSLLV